MTAINNYDAETTAELEQNKTEATVELEQPLKRGEQLITSVIARKPKVGSLRGVSLADLLNMDINAMLKVLPRITSPSISDIELRKMQPADFVSLASEVASFLVPARLKSVDED